MSGVLSWLHAEIADEHGFEIFKIILDKGLLALVVAVAAALLSFVLERYKSNLKRSEELSKIRLPIILKLISQAEVLYDLGETTMTALDAKFKQFDDWLDILDSTPVDARDLSLPNGPEALEQTITMGHGECISVKDFLIKYAASDIVNSVLNQKKFIHYKGHYDHTGFFWILFLRLREPFGERDHEGGIKKEIVRVAMRESVFVPFVHEERDLFYTETNKFRLAMMRSLPREGRRIAKAFDAIFMTLSFMNDTIAEYPPPEVLARFEGIQTLPTSSKRLVSCHAALLSQINVLLEAT